MTNNEIYTYLRNGIVAAYENAYVSSRYENIPASFPAVYIKEIGRNRPINGITLAFDDQQYESTYEIQAFSNKEIGASAEADKVMAKMEELMNDLYFIETMRQPMTNTDPSIYRIVARFHRRLTSGDSIPTK